MFRPYSFVSTIWRILSLLLLGLIFVVPVNAVEIGTEPPGFELPDLSGKRVRLEDFRGKTIILKLATTWCSGCNRQVKEFSGIGTYLFENDIALIEVFVDNEPESIVREYLQQREFDVPTITLIDDGSVARAYRLLGIPWVLLIDREFKVQRERGLITATDLKGQLEKMLK